MVVGDRVFLKKSLSDNYLVEEFSKLSAANVADYMGRLYGMNPSIRLMSNLSGAIMCGVASTVRARPGDNMMFHKAVNMSMPGDVIAISDEGERSRAIMGGIMYNYMQGFKKVAGIMIDGPIWDVDVISKGHLPTYATGTNPAGPHKKGPGEVNVPIACGSITVNPGDIILGDRDGVVVTPRQDAAEILEKAGALSVADRQKTENSVKGAVNRQQVEDLMEKKNVEIIDDVYNCQKRRRNR